MLGVAIHFYMLFVGEHQHSVFSLFHSTVNKEFPCSQQLLLERTPAQKKLWLKEPPPKRTLVRKNPCTRKNIATERQSARMLQGNHHHTTED